MNLGRFNDLIIFSEGLASLGTRLPRDVSLRKLRCDNCTLSDWVDCCWLLHHVVPMNGYDGDARLQHLHGCHIRHSCWIFGECIEMMMFCYAMTGHWVRKEKCRESIFDSRHFPYKNKPNRYQRIIFSAFTLPLASFEMRTTTPVVVPSTG